MGCHKRIFGQYEADREIERCARKLQHGLEHRQETRKYWCTECYGWHLTSKPLKSAPRPLIDPRDLQYMRNRRGW